MILSPLECLLIFGTISLMSFECWVAIRSRSWVQVYRPTLFVAVVLAFYALVGPLRAILATGEVANFVGTSGTIFRGLDHREMLVWGWLGAFLFYGSVLAGFYLFNPQCRPRRLIVQADLRRTRRWGEFLCWLGLGLYFLVNGGKVFFLLNPFRPDQFTQTVGSFSGLNLGFAVNYFSLSINFLISGILIQFAVWLRSRRGLWVVMLWLLASLSIYLSEAFRYRILFLFIPLLLLWLFYNKRRPMLVMLLIFMVGFVSLNGVIGLARTQVRGLDASKVLDSSPLQIVTSSFEEAGAFFATSAVIKSFPEKYNYLQFEPLYTAVLQPLPRGLFPFKPDGTYASSIPDDIYAESWGGYKTHAAFLAYAEYYLMFGWPSLVIASFLLGVLLRRLWTWFLHRQYEPLAQVVYLLNASYLYVVVSRGYLAQIVVLYFFTVLPAFLVYRKLSERV